MVGLDMTKMIMRMIMIAIVAFGVFALFALSYEYYVDVRDAEARVLAREISVCLSEDGILNLDEISESEREAILSYCGYGESDRFYVGASVGFFGEVVRLESGDSGAIWVRDLFDKGEDVGLGTGNVAKNVDEIIRYDPGYFVLTHDVLVVDGGVQKAGEISVEVLVRNDE